MISIGTYIFNNMNTFGELKEFMCSEIKKKLDIELDRKFLLVREHILDKPTRVIIIIFT